MNMTKLVERTNTVGLWATISIGVWVASLTFPWLNVRWRPVSIVCILLTIAGVTIKGIADWRTRDREKPTQRERELELAALTLVGISMWSFIPVLALNFYPPSRGRLIMMPSHMEASQGKIFDIGVWIQEVPNGMTQFEFTIEWDSTALAYDRHVVHANGWKDITIDSSNSNNGLLRMSARGPYVFANLKWLTLSFTCIKSGFSQIRFRNSAWVDSQDTLWNFQTTVEATVSPSEPQTTRALIQSRDYAH